MNTYKKRRPAGRVKWKTFMLALFLLAIFSGPYNTAHAQTATDEAATETEGVLRVGMEANYAPFNWSQVDDANGAIAISNSQNEYVNGYDVQIAKRVAEALDLELEIVKVEWDGLPPALMSGKIDAIIAGMSPTAERKEQIDFSDRYYTSDLVLVVQAGSQWENATSLEDFAGAKVTGQLNTFHETVIDQIPNVDKQTAMDNFPAMISATLSGKVDAYVSERPGAMAAVASNADLTFVTFEEGMGFDVSGEDTSIAVGLRKESPLTEPINEALATISEEEQNAIMQEMVDLNVHGETSGFWGSVWQLLGTYRSLFLRGTGVTLLISIVSTIIGFIIGLLIAVIRTIKINKEHHRVRYLLLQVVDWLLLGYIEIFRGTPMMVQAMIIYYGSKLFLNIDLTMMVAAFIIVSVNTGAYLAEVVRGRIVSVDKGQMEAAKSVGMTHQQAMFNIVLPQAVRNILPSIGNEFITNIKDTSVLNVIAVTELFFVMKSAAGSTYLIFQSYFIASVIYFVLTFTFSRLLRWVEYRLEGSGSYELVEYHKTGNI